MDKIWVYFFRNGVEHPIAKRNVPFVPRVGDEVRLVEKAYRVVGVTWTMPLDDKPYVEARVI